MKFYDILVDQRKEREIEFHPSQVEYANPATLAEAVAPNNAGLTLSDKGGSESVHSFVTYSLWTASLSNPSKDGLLSHISGFYLNYWMNSNCIYYKTTAA